MARPVDPLETELVTDGNFDAQRYLLVNPDLADPYRDGLDLRDHFDRHGRAEGRRQLSGPDLLPPEQRSPGVTLCAIARNEGPYLIEWIAYHRLLGFEHIVIYENASDDGSDQLLARLAAAGLIDHRPWPDMPGRIPQISAYGQAAIRSRTRWIMFIDLDEYVNLRIDRDIGSLLARFDPDVAAVGMNWRIFGSAGQTGIDVSPVMARFTRAAPREHPLNRHIKTVAVAAEIYRIRAHRVRLMHGRYADASGAPLDPGRGFAPVHHDLVQINHYAVKSFEEFRRKRARGSALRHNEDPTKFTHRDGAYFADHDRNEEEDTTILRMFAAAQAEMERIDALIRP